jgi:hypothetical protein
LDLGVGFGTVKAPAVSTNSQGFRSTSESGGLYPSFSGVFRTKHRYGFSGEVAWRAKQSIYGTDAFGNIEPFRPIFYDFNGVYGRTWKKIGADAMAGIGAEDLRFYHAYFNCPGGGFFGCTNYQSSNHFLFHVGGDIRYYVWGHFFIRPEAHYYVIHNNVEFNNANVSRFAISIGYSILPGF